MTGKRVGRFEIRTFADSDWVTVKYHYNDSVSAEIEMRSVNDIFDLQHALSCVLRERSDRNK